MISTTTTTPTRSNKIKHILLILILFSNSICCWSYRYHRHDHHLHDCSYYNNDDCYLHGDTDWHTGSSRLRLVRFRSRQKQKQIMSSRIVINNVNLNYRGGGIIESNPEYVEILSDYDDDDSCSNSGDGYSDINDEDDEDESTNNEYPPLEDLDEYAYDDEDESSSTELRKASSHKSSSLFRKRFKRKHFFLMVLILPVVLYIIRIPITMIALHVLDHPESIAKLAFLLQILSRTVLLYAPGAERLGRTYMPPKVQHFMFECINGRYLLDSTAVKKAIKSVNAESDAEDGNVRSLLSTFMSEKNKNRDSKPKNNEVKKEVKDTSLSILINLKPDQAFSDVDLLRDQVSFILDLHRNNRNTNNTDLSLLRESDLEVILNIESGGGMVQPYALAAAHITRLRNEDGIVVTVCVDQVAASGGYMCACQASPGQLLAAPFALVGSIGVVGQALNIHGVLEKSGVRTLTFKSDEAKAPIGLIGEITEEGIEHVKVQFGEVYNAFKDLVQASRPNINIDEVSGGQVWLGQSALTLGLVDRIVTSDEYISERIRNGGTVLKLMKYRRQGLFSSLQHHSAATSISSAVPFNRSTSTTYYASVIRMWVRRMLQEVKEEFMCCFLQPFLRMP